MWPSVPLCDTSCRRTSPASIRQAMFPTPANPTLSVAILPPRPQRPASAPARDGSSGWCRRAHRQAGSCSTRVAASEARAASGPWPRPSATRKPCRPLLLTAVQESPETVSPALGRQMTPISNRRWRGRPAPRFPGAARCRCRRAHRPRNCRRAGSWRPARFLDCRPSIRHRAGSSEDCGMPGPRSRAMISNPATSRSLRAPAARSCPLPACFTMFVAASVTHRPTLPAWVASKPRDSVSSTRRTPGSTDFTSLADLE